MKLQGMGFLAKQRELETGRVSRGAGCCGRVLFRTLTKWMTPTAMIFERENDSFLRQVFGCKFRPSMSELDMRFKGMKYRVIIEKGLCV